MIHVLRTRIAKTDFILNIEVRAPVAYFCGTFKVRNLQSWSVDGVMNDNTLLEVLDEV